MTGGGVLWRVALVLAQTVGLLGLAFAGMLAVDWLLDVWHKRRQERP